MADNTTLNTGSGGDVVRDKDRSGVKTQIVGLDLNIGGGTETLMAGAMPVTDNGGTLSVDDGGGSLTVDGTVAVSGTVAVNASGTAVPVTDNSSSLTVDAPVGTPVFVTPTPSTSGGWTPWSTSHDNSNTDLGATVVSVKASAGTLGGWFVYNPNSSVAYVQVFNVASASVTLGTTRPNLSIGIPATGAANLEIGNGVQFGTAISIAATTSPSGSTAPTTPLPVTLFYK